MPNEQQGERRRREQKAEGDQRSKIQKTLVEFTGFASVFKELSDDIERLLKWLLVFGASVGTLIDRRGSATVEKTLRVARDVYRERKMYFSLKFEQGLVVVDDFCTNHANPALDRHIEALRQRREQRRLARQHVRRNVFGVRVRS